MTYKQSLRLVEEIQHTSLVNFASLVTGDDLRSSNGILVIGRFESFLREWADALGGRTEAKTAIVEGEYIITSEEPCADAMGGGIGLVTEKRVKIRPA